MNVWLLSSEFPPTTAGGIARYVANAATMLASAGHHVTVVTPDQQESEQILPCGARVLRFRPQSWRLSPGNADRTDTHPAFPYNILAATPALSYEMAERVGAYIRRDGVLPDIIECQEYNALPYYLLQRRMVEQHPLGEVPLLVHLHSPDFLIARANQEPRYRLPRYWVGQMEKFCLLGADALLAPSFYLRRDVEQELPAVAGRIEVIALPYQPLQISPGLPTPGDLVYFGRLEVRKGVVALVQSCKRLWAQGYDFRLTLIGGDTHFATRNMPMSAFLQQRYAGLIATGRLVIQPTPLPPPLLWERLSVAWAVIIPSLWENYPNSCIEAMSLAKLVLASTDGGQAEMIGGDGRAGLLFDWTQPDGCSAGLEQVLTMSIDEVQATGSAARERISALTSFDSVLPQRIAHYQRVIAEHRRHRYFPCVTPGITGHTLPPAATDQPGLISVVVPFYNLGQYLDETVASLVATTYRPLEIIIVDNGSDDPSSLASLERVRVRYSPAVRVLRTDENTGPAGARNFGALASRGEFLAFCDSDDLVEPEFFAKAVDVLNRYSNVSFVYSWVRFFGAYDGIWPTWNTELPYLLGHNMLTVFTVIRRSDYLAYGCNDVPKGEFMEDYETWIAMVAHGCIGVSLSQALVRYRLRPGSLSRIANHDQALARLDQIADRYHAIYGSFGADLFRLQVTNGSSLAWDHPASAFVPSPVAEDEDGLRATMRALLRQIRARLLKKWPGG
jgi:glycogen synthase